MNKCGVNNKKLVLVIGNGFDLDLGLKTSYKDFCNSQYCPSNFHGSCKQKNIVLGTKEFESPNEDYDFLQKAFDVNHNPSSILDDLQNADDVIIFGHSLGENDDPYFRDFFQQQAVGRKVKKRITIFTKSQESEIEIKRSLQQLTGRHLTELRANNDMAIIKTDELYEDPTLLFPIMKHYIEDSRYINPVIKNLNNL